MKGTGIRITANASGGAGELQYRFSRIKDGKTTVFRDYSTTNYAGCNPYVAGTYTICVDVKDEAGNLVTETVDYTWTNESTETDKKLKIDSFTASLASPQAKGTGIRVSANASGGTGELEYRFYRVKDGKTTLFRDYSTTNYAGCNPYVVGTYTIYVDVRDEAGNLATASMSYTWD